MGQESRKGLSGSFIFDPRAVSWSGWARGSDPFQDGLVLLGISLCLPHCHLPQPLHVAVISTDLWVLALSDSWIPGDQRMGAVIPPEGKAQSRPTPRAKAVTGRPIFRIKGSRTAEKFWTSLILYTYICHHVFFFHHILCFVQGSYALMVWCRSVLSIWVSFTSQKIYSLIHEVVIEFLLYARSSQASGIQRRTGIFFACIYSDLGLGNRR